MVQGIYFNLTEAQLLPMRDEVLTQLAAARRGDRFQGGGGHGRSWTKDNLTYDQLREEQAEITAALQRINPTKYGRRVTRLLADFRES